MSGGMFFLDREGWIWYFFETRTTLMNGRTNGWLDGCVSEVYLGVVASLPLMILDLQWCNKWKYTTARQSTPWLLLK